MRVTGISVLLTSIALADPVAAQTSVQASVPASHVKDEHVSVELISQNASFKPGSRAWVGIKLNHEPHWHTYWMNSGDSGLPTRVEWQLPQGYRADAIAWPVPKRFTAGGLHNFGYDDSVLLSIPIDIPADARTAPAVITANVRWVVCSDELCIPGKAALQLTLPVANTEPASSKDAAEFAAARGRQPTSPGWKGRAVEIANSVRVEVRGDTLPTVVGMDVFPTAPNLLSNAPPKVSRNGDRLIIEAAKSDYFSSAPATLDIVLAQTGKSWLVSVPWISGAAGSGSGK